RTPKANGPLLLVNTVPTRLPLAFVFPTSSCVWLVLLPAVNRFSPICGMPNRNCGTPVLTAPEPNAMRVDLSNALGEKPPSGSALSADDAVGTVPRVDSSMSAPFSELSATFEPFTAFAWSLGVVTAPSLMSAVPTSLAAQPTPPSENTSAATATTIAG